MAAGALAEGGEVVMAAEAEEEVGAAYPVGVAPELVAVAVGFATP